MKKKYKLEVIAMIDTSMSKPFKKLEILSGLDKQAIGYEGHEHDKSVGWINRWRKRLSVHSKARESTLHSRYLYATSFFTSINK